MAANSRVPIGDDGAGYLSGGWWFSVTRRKFSGPLRDQNPRESHREASRSKRPHRPRRYRARKKGEEEVEMQRETGAPVIHYVASAVRHGSISLFWCGVWSTIATRLLTTILDIQEKLVTSKLRPSLAIAVDSAISEARRKSHCALNIFKRQIVLREEIIAFIVLSHIIWSS
ncbi:hypothetical protein ALC53_08890 [Atta colombica]|uniref:Uncharacterized protein n=1 Tax=Atta colombica TaxID=520822 RepID=A0A195B888_9HYME|nr:hypothetical protein ALC53_08890 [Atta colombica]